MQERSLPVRLSVDVEQVLWIVISFVSAAASAKLTHKHVDGRRPNLIGKENGEPLEAIECCCWSDPESPLHFP